MPDLSSARKAAVPMDYPTIESCIGNTPLVRLQRLGQGNNNHILLKLEGNNPAGSVKDRPAASMIAEAERSGRIQPGDTLIEATSGNTGIALAMVAAIKGYRMILVMPDNMTAERKIEACAPASSANNQSPVIMKTGAIHLNCFFLFKGLVSNESSQ